MSLQRLILTYKPEGVDELARVREELAEEQRRLHRERADALGRERFTLEERLKERVGGLLEALAALRALDRRQLAARRQAGIDEAFARHDLGATLSSWLAARLGGIDGYVPLPADEWHRGRSLPELDHLALDPGVRD